MKLTCKFCNKEFEGLTKSQVLSQLNIHLISKHSDKVKIQDVKPKKSS